MNSKANAGVYGKRAFNAPAAGKERTVKSAEYRLKRPLDILLSGSGLILSMPLWLIISALIRAESGGPVFYSSKRVGKGGRLFDSYKFRTMVADSDERYGPLQGKLWRQTRYKDREDTQEYGNGRASAAL